MFKKIKTLFMGPSKPLDEAVHDYYDFDDDLDDEDEQVTHMGDYADLEKRLMGTYNSMANPTKILEFGYNSIGFSTGHDKDGQRSNLHMYNLKYRSAPDENVRDDQFPDDSAVILNFNTRKSLRVLIDILEKLEAESIALEFKYRENELLDQGEEA